jgi:hypothetical protein
MGAEPYRTALATSSLVSRTATFDVDVGDVGLGDDQTSCHEAAGKSRGDWRRRQLQPVRTVLSREDVVIGAHGHHRTPRGRSRLSARSAAAGA